MEKFEIFSSNLEVLKKAKYEDLDVLNLSLVVLLINFLYNLNLVGKF